jgi:hypothetical protein
MAPSACTVPIKDLYLWQHYNYSKMSKPTKTAEQYSHDIKLLKYYLEEAIK